MDSSSQLTTGRLGAPWGVKGWIKVTSFSGETKHITRLKEITLKRDARIDHFEIESSAVHQGRAVIKLKGIDSPEAAKAFTGAEILINRVNAPKLAKDEFYLADLTGCRLMADGEVKATVLNSIEGGATDLLEVEMTEGNKVIIPFNREFIGKVDIKKKEIELLIPWILE